MDDIKLALLGNKEAAKRLTDAGVLLPCPGCRGEDTKHRAVMACVMIECLCGFINLLWLFADESCASVVSDFEGLPAADVAEVRHAFWSDYGSGVCCTNCGVSLFHQDENNNWGIEPSKFMFCPSCGALMDEEADHETS